MGSDIEAPAAEALVVALYRHILRRAPSANEFQKWVAAAQTISPAELVERFAESDEARRRRGIETFWPIGHYHSPIVDPSSIRNYVSRHANPGPSGFAAINLDLDAIVRFWNDNLHVIQSAPFTDHRTPVNRFFYADAPFPYGDAISLHAILGRFRPRRIVEIGSGFSTACMLDSAEYHGLEDFRIVCIEPHPARLRSLLRPSDYSTVDIIEKPVQDVSISRIANDLDVNDILFIDSTHVLKTGSDVHYELFHILPALKAGVIIHLHDCPYPFEYPSQWLYGGNYSWNEVYALRAFLMYNEKFSVLFWGSMLKALFAPKIKREGGVFSINSGTSIWLSRVE